MAFPEDQLTYLNATVSNLNSQLGWGSEPSSLSITLVEDESLNQTFIEPTVGMPTYFDYNGWSFGGIVQSWTRNRGSGGFTFSVLLNDPRDILDGAAVVLYGYTGITFGLSNLYNVFGYLESSGFGASGASETGGINGRLAITTLQGLINTTPIQFRGYTYYVDLTNLYNLMSADYRILNEQMNIMELISSIATDAICDFFIRLEYRSGTNYIVPYFVSRANPPVLGSIANFVNTSEVTYGTISNTVGRELVNEVASKMLVGGKVCKMYYNSQNTSDKYLYGIHNSKHYGYLTELGNLDEITIENFDPTEIDVNNKFVNWRKRLRIHAQNKAEEANIWPYWGHDARGNLVISYGIPESTYLDTPNGSTFIDNNLSGQHMMIIDGREIAQIISQFYGGRVDPYVVDYITDTAELTFALEGFDEWLRYILITSVTIGHHNCFFHVEDAKLECVNQFGITVYNGIRSKAESIGINGILNFRYYYHTINEAFRKSKLQINTFISNNLQNIFNKTVRPTYGNIDDISGITSQFITDLHAVKNNSVKNPPNTLEIILFDALEDIYEVIRSFADKHLGKTYMVRTPSIQARRDVDTDEIIYSVQQTSGGFFEESVWATAIQNNLMPSDTQKLLTSDNRLRSYVRFTNKIITRNNFSYGALNPSKIGLGNLITNYNELNPNNPYAEYFYVLCEVEDAPVFLDNSTLDDARLVIEIPDAMLLRQPRGWNPILQLYWHALKQYTRYLNVNYTPSFLRDFYDSCAYLTFKNLFAGVPGNDGFLNSTILSPTVMPDLAVIALESATERYGPWFVQGGNGKTELEPIDGLVPWNYGSFTALNAVANAQLYQAASSRQEVEKGTIEFPGAPTFLLGDAMVTDGPVITSINVQIDPQAGVTTSYSLQTWTKQFGELPKRYADKISQLNTIIHKNNSEINKVLRNRNKGESNINFTAGRKNSTAPRKKSIHSSMLVIGAAHNYRVDDSGNHLANCRAAIMPGYYLENQAYDRYEDKAFMSIDGMFRPYCTETTVGASGMPHFEVPTAGATFPTVNDLNPFGGNHDVNLVSQNLNLDTTEVDNPFENKVLQNITDFPSPTSVKAISLKGPAVITGWGYDVNGKPVPANTENPDEFVENHRMREDLWKTGPLDTRWDDDRKVWTTPPVPMIFGKLIDTVYATRLPSSGRVQVYQNDDLMLTNANRTYNTVYVRHIGEYVEGNALNGLPSGINVVLQKNGDTYDIINDYENRTSYISTSIDISQTGVTIVNFDLTDWDYYESSWWNEDELSPIVSGIYLFDLTMKLSERGMFANLTGKEVNVQTYIIEENDIIVKGFGNIRAYTPYTAPSTIDTFTSDTVREVYKQSWGPNYPLRWKFVPSSSYSGIGPVQMDVNGTVTHVRYNQ